MWTALKGSVYVPLWYLMSSRLLHRVLYKVHQIVHVCLLWILWFLLVKL